jgi:hypothetical protein
MDREIRKQFLTQLFAHQEAVEEEKKRSDEHGLSDVVDRFAQLFKVAHNDKLDPHIQELEARIEYLEDVVQLMRIKMPRSIRSDLSSIPSELNGANGEATMSDDVHKLFVKPNQLGSSHGEMTEEDDLKNRSSGYSEPHPELKKKKKKKGGILKKLGIKKMVSRAARGALMSAATGGNPVMGAASGFIGSGDYEPIVANTIVHGTSSALEKSFSGTSTNGFSWANSEYITDIYSQASSTFSTVIFPCNAGLSQVFRFFAQIAANFDKFRFKQLVYKLKSVYSTYSSTGNLGSCFIAFVTNAGTIPFNSKPALMEYSGAVSAKVSQDIIMGVECASSGATSGGWYYTRNGPVPSGQTIQQYDPGFLQIALSGVPTSGQVYELHVSYEIEVADPKLWQSIGYMIPFDRFLNGGTVNTSNFLGTAPFECATNSIGCIMTKNNTNKVIFPDSFSGNVRVQIWMQTTVYTGAIVMSKTLGANIVDYNDLVVSGANTNNITVSVAGSTLVMYDYTLSIAASPGGNSIGLGGLSAITASTVTLEVIGLNGYVGPFGVAGQGMILA